MKKVFFSTFLLIISLSAGAEVAIDMSSANIDKGENLAKTVCAACHSADGNSVVAIYPKIAGQHPVYLVKSMQEYKKGQDGGKRFGPLMYEQMKNITEQDMIDVAAFLSTKEMMPGGAVSDLVPLGRSIYLGGNLQSKVPACAACHGANGKGNKLANFPHLAGQHVDYLVSQLKKFRSKERMDAIGGMMNDVAKNLTDEEIEAVASYISGLH